MLNGCVSHKVDHYNAVEPTFDIQEYFTGEIHAWGLVQDWRGRVVNRFEIKMFGQWEGDVGTLQEDFDYYDGEEKQRIWTIQKLKNGDYQGFADDIIDAAKGVNRGNAVKWVYVMKLPVGNKTYDIHFDDWMWQMKNGVVINRSYLKKFGVTVAELSLFMQKVENNSVNHK